MIRRLPRLLAALLAASTTLAAGAPKFGLREDLYAVRRSTDGDWWIAGASGTLLHSPRDGERWERRSPSFTGSIFDVSFPTGERGFAVGVDGTIFRSDDRGRRWQRQETPGDRHVFAVDFGDADFGVAVGDWGTIWVTEDGGATWTDRSHAEDVVLYDVRVISSESFWVVGEAGAILRATDRGRQIERSTEAEASLFAGAADGALRGIAVGLAGTIVATEDGGVTWMKRPSPTRRSLYDVTLRGMEGWIVGEAGVVLRTRDGGRLWTREVTAGPRVGFWHGVSSGGDGTVAVGEDGALRWLP